MTQDEAWKIFKNTGSIEAYITFAQSRNSMEKNVDADNSKDERNNNQNKGYTG